MPNKMQEPSILKVGVIGIETRHTFSGFSGPTITVELTSACSLASPGIVMVGVWRINMRHQNTIFVNYVAKYGNLSFVITSSNILM